MLSTKIKLKCTKGPLPKIYFQFPHGMSPGDLEPLSKAQISFLDEGTLMYEIFVNILPGIAGVLVFLFFLTASGFILYGLVRHYYSDRLLLKKTRLLKRLGKHPVRKRRKKYRSRQKSEVSDNVSHKSVGSTSVRSYGKLLRAEDKPYYFDDISEVYSSHETLSSMVKRNSARPPLEVISFTSPPNKIDPNALPVVNKPIDIPGQPFPTLPDVPGKKLPAVPNVPVKKLPEGPNVPSKKLPVESPNVPSKKLPIEGPNFPNQKLSGPSLQNMTPWNSTFQFDNSEEKKQTMTKHEIENLTETRTKLRDQWMNRAGKDAAIVSRKIQPPTIKPQVPIERSQLDKNRGKSISAGDPPKEPKDNGKLISSAGNAENKKASDNARKGPVDDIKLSSKSNRINKL